MKSLRLITALFLSTFAASATASTFFEYDDNALSLAKALSKCPAELAQVMEDAEFVMSGSFMSPRPANAEVMVNRYELTTARGGFWIVPLEEVAKLTILETIDWSNLPTDTPARVSYTCAVTVAGK